MWRTALSVMLPGHILHALLSLNTSVGQEMSDVAWHQHSTRLKTRCEISLRNGDFLPKLVVLISASQDLSNVLGWRPVFQTMLRSLNRETGVPFCRVFPVWDLQLASVYVVIRWDCSGVGATVSSNASRSVSCGWWRQVCMESLAFDVNEMPYLLVEWTYWSA